MSKTTAWLHTVADSVMFVEHLNGAASFPLVFFAGMAAFYCWALVPDD